MPKLRRFRTLPTELLLALFTLRPLCDPKNTGSLFKASGTLDGVVAANWSVVTTVSGVGEFVMLEMTREPVTTTDSTVLSVDLWELSEDAEALCALAGWPPEKLNSSANNEVDVFSDGDISRSSLFFASGREIVTIPSAE